MPIFSLNKALQVANAQLQFGSLLTEKKKEKKTFPLLVVSSQNPELLDPLRSQPSIQADKSKRARRDAPQSHRLLPPRLGFASAMASSTASWSRYGTVPAAHPAAKHEEVVDGDGEVAAPSPSPATAAEAGVAFFSRARAVAGAAAGRPRAWREVLDATAFSRPESCGEARARARRNLAYFRANYALVGLVLVFLGLVYRPVSMLAFLALFVAWLGLYFGRADGEPLVCLGREVDDRVVLAVLSVATVLAVALTRAGLNLLVSLLLAAAVIGVHAAFRMNVYLDERDAFDAAGSSFMGSSYGGYTLPR
ncbi:hypothetical protein E2562_018990 [Oryza meyeriana var. granulata]|uniref:PRA1 family protein n=1 Tax=Oryza meyeriana var. granulata TaxID=110450 RepID=A0A6G1DJV3_9ORYZ|nr:hypothetical protein E2562_018990 [Oryza meyeriana var. granulata]